ncbi:MAG TPA: glycosyltransferase family 1 protein [Quisquiliibacterium sp.]|nr:glycosyltransferase family 1 protein [Quisquiliibacterium sp.]
MPQPAPPRLDEAQTFRLLRLHRRALAFRNAQHEADLLAGVDLAYRDALAARCERPLEAGDARIYYNVSSLCRRRFPNSTDRVVLALKTELARLPVQLVPAAFDGQGWRAAVPASGSEDPAAPRMAAAGPPISPRPGDHFLGAEFDYRLPPSAYAQLARMKRGGLRISTVVHDLFTVTRPEWFSFPEILAFDQWLQRTGALSDRIVCFSQHVARQLRRWFATAPMQAGALRRQVAVSVADPGSDGLRAEGPSPQWGASGDAASFALPDDGVPTFLTIAATHPRKGVDTLVGAFSQLWNQGADLRLVLSGRSVDEGLAARIRAHPRAGDRLLFPGFLGDAQLRQVAARAQALIVPSREEGFGLPVAEAAALGLPVIARDIPVFREIAGDQPFWFESGRGLQHTLAARMRDWLELTDAQRRRHVPTQAEGPWSRTATQLAVIMFGDLDFDRLEIPMPARPSPATPAGQSSG